jgi:VWFA-related protein
MMFVSTVCLFLCLAALGLRAQETSTSPPTLTVHSNLVIVPTLVKNRDGEIVFELKATDFILTDNNMPQHLALDRNTDFQPLALAICVETGGAGAGYLSDYRKLDAILDTLIGNVDHKVAIIGFDSAPHLLLPFTSHVHEASLELANLRAGDNGASILDAVAFAIAQLQGQPAGYRHAILLLSETVDQGSTTTLKEALRLISNTNTAIYSFGFSSTGSAVRHEAGKFNRDDPGPAGGCFSRAGADAEYKGRYSRQVLDCISDLAPPLRLATMTFLTARDGLRTNTAESIAKLTGGEFFRFHNTKDLQASLVAASNDVPNYYILSFRPTLLTPGLHALHLEIRGHPKLVVKYRTEYWTDDDTAGCSTHLPSSPGALGSCAKAPLGSRSAKSDHLH